jgi:uncharacterized protein
MNKNLDICLYAEPVTVEDRTLKGYAVVFNVLSNDRGGYRDTFTRQSVNRTLDSGSDVLVINYHDVARPLARRKNGGLQMKVDNRGLFVEFAAPKTREGDDLLELVKTGVIAGMSFGTRILKADWKRVSGNPVRSVTDMEIHHVSPVADPAFTQTSLTAQTQLSAFLNEERRRSLAMAERIHRQNIA